MTILIVDDDPIIQQLLLVMLRSGGYADAQIAGSVGEAFRLLGVADDAPALRCELILMDITLPDMTGLEAAQRIKAIDWLQDVPIIVVSGHEETAAIKAAFDVGVVDYITKPLNKVELLARVRSALRLHQEMDRRKAREQELLAVTAQLKAANAQLQYLSTHDGLTGLANRPHFDDVSGQEWRRAARAGSSLALLMIDVDHFKAYNDHYGHLAGDECLRKVARALASVAQRPGDLVARYGGEEFVAVLPETDLAGARHLAEEVRAAIEGLCIEHRGSRSAEGVTVSVGASACHPADGLRLEYLLSFADDALYQSKAAGRNHVTALALSLARSSQPTPQ
ncbi:MAG TPA: diguanylate cyclase [Herpetosiphonaceae bacterium]